MYTFPQLITPTITHHTHSNFNIYCDILHTFSNLSGIIVNSPVCTALRAFSAKGSMVTNHCLITSGSII